MTVLVTGATGVAGSYIVEALMTTEAKVRVLAMPHAVHRLRFRDRIEVVPGHLHDERALSEAVAGVETVFHAAVLASGKHRLDDYAEVVHDGTRRLLAALPGSVRRIVFVSSSDVYAPHRAPETWPVLDDAPREAHGASLDIARSVACIRAEDEIFEASACGGPAYTILRPTQICGRDAQAVDQAVEALIRNPQAVQATQGRRSTMQWVHGTDLARACLSAAEAPEAANQCFLIAGGEAVTELDLLSLIWDLINPGAPGNPHAAAARGANPGRLKFAIDKAERLLGWTPGVTVRTCLQEVLGRLDFHSTASMGLPGRERRFTPPPGTTASTGPGSVALPGGQMPGGGWGT